VARKIYLCTTAPEQVKEVPQLVARLEKVLASACIELEQELLEFKNIPA
jgi:hypothetical protein